MGSDTVQISVRVSAITRERFKAAVALSGSSTQEVLETAIKEYLDKYSVQFRGDKSQEEDLRRAMNQ